ncbi:3',5'-cyclic-nucleotide phosphodiesterase [Coemansia sp. RSA 1813]|nr:3',5'-cyclic-nucleotide phosphodiesterase [Coemansia sp. RSA 1646]KAJ1767922.1 3',5'-cyclic-nucleotide phosphodiesterase [Coemansia sp. RSA 1843]KAJ2086490.1 3',5'-cyclic-nucleotide phosphodiesterase [Coemansia sp. RSA 986]KAJ2213498.1 3',5'-cyclic-nucleotide phosphodiesterase [Coemansia sp. RSA 487]KAJ2564838.1 3',5'-cyclic-nucleotide phosphodiesterase [Coemansia sp. RSA 1813]
MASAQLAPSVSHNLRNPILDRARDADPLLSYYKRRNSVHNINYAHSIRATRTQPHPSASQSVAMSSSHDPNFMRQAAGIGAMNYLVKPISAETVHSLWLNVFSCRTHNQTTAAVAAAAVARRSVSGMTIDDRASQTANSAALLAHNESCGDASTLSPQQSIFQRRIRTDTINGASTADARNASFEEDFIRQFVPAISSTLPTTSASGGADDYLDDCNEELEHEFMTSSRIENLRMHLLDWSFCPYEMDSQDLIDCIVIMIMDSAACVDLKLRISRVRKFASILESAYYDNPYHNFHHAVDVTQCTFYILHTLGLFSKSGYRRSSLRSPADASFPLRSILRPTDTIALVVASLCHDLGHPGLNNAFMVRAHTQLAEVYNDQSVLENFHAACFSMIMSYFFADFGFSNGACSEDEGARDPANPSAAPPNHFLFDYEEFRRVAVHAILATDMARHFEFIGKCKAQHERFKSRSNLPMTLQQHEAERAQLAASILKCADISNIVRPFNISQRWTRRLNKEVTLQGNIEESLGMSRTMVVDMENVPTSQIAFYETCGRPLFNAVADLVPELRFMADQLENNIRNWGFIKNNQRVPEVPYGLKHSSTFELSISTRAGSTDSAPDFLQKRSYATSSIAPAASVPFDISTTTVENEHLASYTLHASDSIDRMATGDDLSATTRQVLSSHDSSDSGKLVADGLLANDSSLEMPAHLYVSTGVLSPSQSQH